MSRTLGASTLVFFASACSGPSEQPGNLRPSASAPVTQDASGGDADLTAFDAGLPPPPTCTKRTCADEGANCGPVADGCGGLTESCGTCAAGTVCGGGGIASRCGTTIGDGGGCIPRTCEKAGANCGPIGDGCGGVIDCGKCSGDRTCGGGGTPSVCGVSYVPPDGGALGDGGTCVKRTCAEQGANCGPVGDGCGGTVECGTCTNPGEICGGTTPSVCGSPFGDSAGCTPRTCADVGANCGPIGDGCGGLLECGTCSAPNICGGGGKPSVCGNAYGSCTPKTCADYPGATCGQLADGCGGLTASCGTCASPTICGGGGTPNVCGNSFGACKPQTCADLGANCGLIGDGCGGTASCGTCTAPDICGGAGVPSKCGGSGGVVPGCTDPLCAKIPICTTGETTIEGTVYAPNGVQPLYNAVVYIPKGTVAPFGDVISCDRCDTPRPALASAVTGPDGRFKLTGALPAGPNIPLVIELGRWRRYVTIPNVSACVSNPEPATLTRMPRRQAEGHALDNIPRMAMTTGNVDAMECVLRKMGLEDSVFANPTFADASKRIHFYRDNGAAFSASTPSWTALADDPTAMRKYDAIIYACRGSEGTARSSARKDALRAYANEGGRVFATHYSYMWLFDNDNWATSASWVRDGGPATSSNTVPLVSDVNTSFPKGLAFSQWLSLVGALSSTTPPRVDILASRKDVTAALSPALPWITSDSPKTAQHMTFNTPFKGATSSLCGRVLFSDFHVTNASTDGKTFPAECAGGDLTAQEKVLEFMLFDLASCVNGDNLPPPPPPTCTPKTCADAGAKCGQVANGCGGLTPSCGTCPAGETCGGGGKPGVCGGPTCTPVTCVALGYECGLAGDGCGGSLSCGVCTVPGETCGSGGVPGKCGGPKCTPQTCASTSTMCGWIGDGCGGKSYCGDCVAPDICGGGGVAGKCGSPKCTPRTCAATSTTCGWIGDGCGGKTFCGDCLTAGETCGGSGLAGVCGKPGTTPCKPRTCVELGLACGPGGDGCGNLIDCGVCVAPETCGGSGVAGVCGAPKCTPTTCVALGFACGLAADGCGGSLDCGTCVAPSTCGGDGVAHQCSVLPR